MTKQQTASATRIVQKPIGEIWPLISDLGQVYKYHPLVSAVEVSRDKTSRTGLGAHRVRHFKDGTSFHEEITSLEQTPTHKTISLRISEYSFPMSSFDLVVILTPEDNGEATKIRFKAVFRLEKGTNKFLSAIIIKRQTRKMLARVLESMDRHLKTGQIFGGTDRKSFEPQSDLVVLPKRYRGRIRGRSSSGTLSTSPMYNEPEESKPTRRKSSSRKILV